jgi:hypothetical protein
LALIEGCLILSENFAKIVKKPEWAVCAMEEVLAVYECPYNGFTFVPL